METRGRAEAGPIGGGAIRYVALGDSYTIGTSVDPGERWPDRLVRALRPASVDLVANLAVNGYTSLDVLEREIPRALALEPGLATLLVGVNDVVRGVPPESYRQTMAAILDGLLGALPPSRVVIVSTPDYTLTPEGSSYGDPRRRAAEIRRFNAIEAELAEARRIAVVDILDLSEGVASDPSLVAEDGLHPSSRQYRLWVGRIAPVVRRLITQPQD